MNIFYAPILFLLTSYPVFSQKNIPAFGEIDAAELKMATCSFEPDANAMKLFDVQEMEYEPSAFGGRIRVEKRVRIKIFNIKGYPFATIKIPYYRNKNNTKVESLQGMIYSMDETGNLVKQKVEEADFFNEKATKQVGVILFTFPNLKPGSIIEYNYVLSEKSLEFDTWVVQSEIPSAYSSVALITPIFSDVKEIVFGNESFSKRKELLTKGLDKDKRVFFKENISSFQPEPYMSSYNDNLLRMGFVLFKDKSEFMENFSPQSIWKLAANFLLKSGYFDDQYKKVIRGTEKIIDTALTILNQEERLNYLYHIVKKRFPSKSGQTGFPEDINDAWKNHTGSSAEINMLLINLLKRSNITCHPVFVSTREHGNINTDFPNFGQFNGLDVFVTVNDVNYLLDAGQKFQSFSTPPLNILNRKAFVLDPDNIHWVMITDNRPLLKQTTDIFADLTEKGLIDAGASLTYYDYAKSIALDSTLQNQENKKGEIFDKELPGLKIKSEQKENIDTDDPFIQRIEFEYEVPHSDSFYFINPMLFTTKKTNPFIADKRITDIDMGCNQEFRLTMQLDIPSSFQAEHIPQNIIVRSPDSSFAFTRLISISQSKISFLQKLEIKKAIFDKNEYSGLFVFFSQMQKISSEEIILKKIR